MKICCFAATAVFTSFLALTSAHSQTITNGSFESGDFTGWQTIGVPAVVQAQPSPTDGSYQALINSTDINAQVSWPDYLKPAAAASAADLQTFLNTTLPANSEGSAINGQAIQQSFTTIAGATITFSYCYLSREAPSNGFDETGYVINGVFHPLADSLTPNQSLANGTAFLSFGTVYKTITITVGPGTTQLGFVAYNTSNGKSPTGLYIDNVIVTPLTTPYAATYANFTPPGSIGTTVNAITGGNIVGTYTTSTSNALGFFYDGTNLTTLSVPGSTNTLPNGVSGSNAVGEWDDVSNNFHAFSYDGTNFTNLIPPGSIDATANAISGQYIAGVFLDNSNNRHAFLYDGTTYTTISPPSTDTHPSLIVSALSGNVVVGSYFSGPLHGFIYSGGVISTIDPAGSLNTVVTSVSGTTAAGYYTDSTFAMHGFTYHAGTYTIIDVPGGTNTHVNGIFGNNLTGYFTGSDHNLHGFFTDGNTFTQLDAPSAANTKPAGISGLTIAGNIDSATAFIAVMNPSMQDATITFDQLYSTYDGTAKPITATTIPANLNVSITYNGSSTPPTAAGDYPAIAMISDATYEGMANFTYTVAQAPAFIGLGNLTFIYDGTPKSTTATTTPSSLSYALTYNGNSSPPSAVGRYTVNATVTDPNYQPATASGTLVISPNNYDSWSAFYSLAGPSDKPLNDFVPNGLKYLCDIDPTVAMTADDQAALPSVHADTINGTNYLTITYRQNPIATDLNLQPQSSSDLQTWNPISDPNFPRQVGTATNGDVLIEYGVPYSSARQFIRLQLNVP